MSGAGKVSLVGAGPGDPGLITAKGLALLQAADVVVHDRLIDERLLEHARTDALLINAGKRRGGHLLSQDEINAVLVEHGAAGSAVVRLKGGDPFVFGRGARRRWHWRRRPCPSRWCPASLRPSLRRRTRAFP